MAIWLPEADPLSFVLCICYSVCFCFVCVNDMTRFDMHKVKRAGRGPIVYYLATDASQLNG